jgi:hypothetical protein
MTGTRRDPIILGDLLTASSRIRSRVLTAPGSPVLMAGDVLAAAARGMYWRGVHAGREILTYHPAGDPHGAAIHLTRRCTCPAPALSAGARAVRSCLAPRLAAGPASADRVTSAVLRLLAPGQAAGPAGRLDGTAEAERGCTERVPIPGGSSETRERKLT